MAEKPVQSKKKALRLSGVERKRLATQQHRPRILDFIANNHYRGLNRDQVVDDLLESTQCTEKDRPSVRGAIAKTLGRLIHDGHLIENLTIGDRPKSRGDGSRVKRHRGYVAVTVNPTSIREARERREAALKNQRV